MSQRIGNFIIIAETPPARCELCGKIDGLRPYGPNGENICFDCGEANREVTERNMRRILFGVKN